IPVAAPCSGSSFLWDRQPSAALPIPARTLPAMAREKYFSTPYVTLLAPHVFIVSNSTYDSFPPSRKYNFYCWSATYTCPMMKSDLVSCDLPNAVVSLPFTTTGLRFPQVLTRVVMRLALLLCACALPCTAVAEDA